MKLNIFFIALSTLLQVLWTCLIARHYNVFAITCTLFIFISLSIYILNRSIFTYPWYNRAILGAIIGFIGGIVAAFAAELALRGTSILIREYPISNFYFFPTLLLGWVYGAILFTIVPPILESRLVIPVNSDQ